MFDRGADTIDGIGDAARKGADDDWCRNARELLSVPQDVTETMTKYTDDPAAVYRWRDAMADLIESSNR